MLIISIYVLINKIYDTRFKSNILSITIIIKIRLIKKLKIYNKIDN